MTPDHKTSDNLLEIVEDEIDRVEEEFNVRVVAWCTDAGGDEKGMRRRLVEKRPHIITLDCYGHQLNLVVADLLKANPILASVMGSAVSIVKWINNHSLALGLLRQCQAASGRILALLMPALMRWTSHFKCTARLLETEKALKTCVINHRDELIDAGGPSRDQRQKAEGVIKIIENEGFWTQLRLLRRCLEPIAIANNVAQAADTRLDHVGVMFGNLFRTFSDPTRDPVTSSTLRASLGKRFETENQEAFIASVHLNPYIRNSTFNKQQPALLPIGLHDTLARFFKRMFPDHELDSVPFFEAHTRYVSWSGEFSSETMGLDIIRQTYESKGEQVSVVHVWNQLDNGTWQGSNQLVKLAIHLLSIVPNSAGCERLFSNMGIVHNKPRNRMHLQTVVNTVTVKAHIRREQEEIGLLRSRRKRAAGAEEAIANPHVREPDGRIAPHAHGYDDAYRSTELVVNELLSYARFSAQQTDVPNHNQTHFRPRIIALADVFDYSNSNQSILAPNRRHPASLDMFVEHARKAFELVANQFELRREDDFDGWETIDGNPDVSIDQRVYE